jgi:hypothetical protein
MLLLRAKSGPPKTTVKGNTVVVDRHISGNLEETRAIPSRRLRGKQNLNVTRRMTKKTAVIPQEEVQQIIDHLEDKHKEELRGAHNFANTLADKMRSEFLAAYDAKEAERVHHIGKAQEATEKAKKVHKQLKDMILVAKSAKDQLRAAKKTVEEKTKAEEDRKARLRAARAARAKAKPRMRAKAKSSSPAPKAKAIPGSPSGRVVLEMARRGAAAASSTAPPSG